jgi:hypothetical protein
MEILLILKFLTNNFVFLNKQKNQSHIKLFSAVLEKTNGVGVSC